MTSCYSPFFKIAYPKANPPKISIPLPSGALLEFVFISDFIMLSNLYSFLLADIVP